MKRILSRLLPVLLAALLLSSCSSIENPAKPPHSSSAYPGMSYDDVLAELQDAGFSNIQTTDVPLKSESQAGTVKSVTIDGDTSYSTGNVWESTVPVEIVRYVLEQLDVSIDVQVGGEDGKPEFSIKTNLPDGVKLLLTLSDDDFYTEQQTVKVSDGAAISEPFTNGGGPLSGGYDLTVVMQPWEQGFLASSSVGSSGQYLCGPLVQQSDGGAYYVFFETRYESPFEVLSGDALKDAARSFDSSVLAVLSAAEQDYNSFIDGLSSGTMSDLEIYNAAEDLKGSTEYILNVLDSIDYGTLSGAKDVLDAASSYVYSMHNVADRTLSYLDDQKTSVLHDLQTSMETVSTFAVSFVAWRSEFLSACGFSADEIAELPGASS